MKSDLSDKVLIIPDDMAPEALMAYVATGAVPPGARVEDIEVWMARGRVPDCDCGLLQCQCALIRPHARECLFRRSILSVFDVGILDCSCGLLADRDPVHVE